MRSRFVVGWLIFDHAPNSDVVIEVLGQAMIANGIPQNILFDNGDDFAGSEVQGSTKKERREALKFRGKVVVNQEEGDALAAELRSLLGGMGVNSKFAIAYNAKAKPIERFFGTTARAFSRWFATWCGANPQERPEDHKDFIKHMDEVPTLDQVRAAFGHWVDDYYHVIPHSGGGMDGRSPRNAYDEFMVQQIRGSEHTIRALCWKPVGPLKVGRNGVQWHKIWFGRDNDELLAMQGQKVCLRIDRTNLSRVTVWSAAGDRFLFVADRVPAISPNADMQTLRKDMPTDYVATKVAEEMRSVINVAQRTGSIVAIIAPSGCGKTMVLKAMAEKMNGHYLYCHEDMTPAAFLHALAKAVGIASTAGSKWQISGGIIDKLRGTNRMIFLDEAHRLPRDAFARIRTVHDAAEVPMCLAGTHEILGRINDRANGAGQMSSRCMTYSVLEHVFNAEDTGGGSGDSPGTGGRKIRGGRQLFTVEEVKNFFASLSVRVSDDALRMAWALICLPDRGCFRLGRRIVQVLRPEPEQRSEMIERGEIVEAVKLLFGLTGETIIHSARTHAEAFAIAV